MINLPAPYKRMRFDRIETTHGIFALYRGYNGRGIGKSVNSFDDYFEYTAEDVGFSKVKSVMVGLC